MSQGTKRIQVFIVAVLTLLACGMALAQDDGARTSWKAMDKTNIIAFQYLPFDGDSFGSKVFDPVHYVYPESEMQANIFMLTYLRHFTLFDRTAVFGASVLGGNLDVESFGSPLTGGGDFKQAAHGFGDPMAQLALNVFGAPAIRSFYDISKYEPKAVLDVSVLGAFPIGQYDSDRVVNMSLNRWWTRIAAPFTYHLGPFVPGYRTSVEFTPSVYLLGSNDDFVGRKLDNDPLYQLEAHVTRDFTSHFFGSVDFLYRQGMLSKINDGEVGGKLSLLSAGFTLDYHVNDNVGLRVSYHSLVGGGSNVEGDMFRLNVN
ncbi:hypothetical protein KAJ77_10315, partial [bacterium]|nr:hypothetical protein [bacterium]